MLRKPRTSSTSSKTSGESEKSSLELVSDDLLTSGYEYNEDAMRIRNNYESILAAKHREYNDCETTVTSENQSDSEKEEERSASSKSRSRSSKSASHAYQNQETLDPRYMDCDYTLELGGPAGAIVLRPGTVRSPAKDAYLGVITRQQAEHKVTRPCTFALYHPLSNPTEVPFIRHLSLAIVYKTDYNTYRHYAIERISVAGYEKYRVVCGRESPRFTSLDALVKYYSTYVSFSDYNGERRIEVLPIPRKRDSLLVLSKETAE